MPASHAVLMTDFYLNWVDERLSQQLRHALQALPVLYIRERRATGFCMNFQHM